VVRYRLLRSNAIYGGDTALLPANRRLKLISDPNQPCSLMESRFDKAVVTPQIPARLLALAGDAFDPKMPVSGDGEQWNWTHCAPRFATPADHACLEVHQELVSAVHHDIDARSKDCPTRYFLRTHQWIADRQSALLIFEQRDAAPP